MPHVHSFAPIENPAATVLILGSMPGAESINQGKYYAHPRNHFWKIMGELLGASHDLTYAEQLNMLRTGRIALWDVLESCIRDGSLDTRIVADSEVPNDFNAFFRKHPNITHVFFNGAKAEQCFHKHIQPSLKTNSLKFQRLPSTSPANAGMSHQQKLVAWQAVIRRAL